MLIVIVLIIGCNYVLHSTSQLLSHKRKHERRDQEYAYRKQKQAQKAFNPTPTLPTPNPTLNLPLPPSPEIPLSLSGLMHQVPSNAVQNGVTSLGNNGVATEIKPQPKPEVSNDEENCLTRDDDKMKVEENKVEIKVPQLPVRETDALQWLQEL